MQDLSLLLPKSRPRNVKTQDLTWQGGGVFCKATEQHRVTGHFPEHRKSVSSNMGLYLVFRLAVLSFSHERTKTFQRKSQLPTWNATKFRCQKFSFPTKKRFDQEMATLQTSIAKAGTKTLQISWASLFQATQRNTASSAVHGQKPSCFLRENKDKHRIMFICSMPKRASWVNELFGGVPGNLTLVPKINLRLMQMGIVPKGTR